jgi:hypothetical protein
LQRGNMFTPRVKDNHNRAYLWGWVGNGLAGKVSDEDSVATVMTDVFEKIALWCQEN